MPKYSIKCSTCNESGSGKTVLEAWNNIIHENSGHEAEFALPDAGLLKWGVLIKGPQPIIVRCKSCNRLGYGETAIDAWETITHGKRGHEAEFSKSKIGLERWGDELNKKLAKSVRPSKGRRTP